MNSRHIFIATGAGKADAVKAMIEGGAQRWPACILQHHPDVTVLLDEAAASSSNSQTSTRGLGEGNLPVDGFRVP